MAFKIDAKRLKWAALTVLAAVFLDGCKPINQFFVKTFVKPAYLSAELMAESVVLPYTLETDDLEMGCVSSEALTNLIMSSGRVMRKPNELGTILHVAAASCEEERAFNEELEYLRYIRMQQPDMAQDALIRQKTHHLKAAKRYMTGWNNFTESYKDYQVGSECPPMEQEFDQLVWLLGMFAGVQATNHDILSGVGIGVPKNLVAQIERAMGCMSNKKWFGIPLSLKAAIWSLLPGALPEGEDNWARLNQADQMGEEAGVRLPHFIHLIVAHTKGENKLARDIIKKHVKSIEEQPANLKYATFDAVATQGIQRISDKMWTEAKGHKTPIGGLGTFWDENPADNIETVDLDDLF